MSSHDRSGPASLTHQTALQTLADGHAAAARGDGSSPLSVLLSFLTSSAAHHISRALQSQLVLHSTTIVPHSIAQHHTACHQYTRIHTTGSVCPG